MSEQHTPQTMFTVPAWTPGWRLQRALAHAGLTTEAMAAEMGVTRSTISRWINDKGSEPRRAYVNQWALRCGVPVEWLRDGIDPETGPDEPISAVTLRYRADRLAAVVTLPLAS